MILETWEVARGRRASRKFAQFDGYRTDFIWSPTDRVPAPQAFLIEQAPNFTVRPHFHREHQFQVVVSGHGKLGKHSVRPFAVHYTARETAYGPIVSGDAGLAYLTMRAVNENGAGFFMPESRPLLQPGMLKLTKTAEAWEDATDGELQQLDKVVVSTRLEPQASGLGAWHIQVPAGTSAAAPAHPGGAGRFYIVTAGALNLSEKLHPRLTVLWISPEEEPFQMLAGPGGLEMLALQFPEAALKPERLVPLPDVVVAQKSFSGG